MSLLTNSLNVILDRLRKNNSDIVLQPGLSYEQIKEKVASLPFCLPKELYKLYQWKNGTPEYSNSKCVYFFEYYRFLPLEESLQIILDTIEDNGWLEDWLFPYGWFPIFTFEGEYYSVIGSEKQRDSSPIIRIYHDETLEYISLTAMMQTIAECYQTGAYYIDDEGYWETKQNEEEQISLKYNPGVIINSYYEDRHTEIIKKYNKLKIINTYSKNRSCLISTNIEDYQKNIQKRIEYLGGKIIRMQTSNIRQDSCYNHYVVEERYYCDYDKHESQEIAIKKGWFKWEVTRIERRYINNILKKETIDTNLETKVFSISYLIIFLICFWFASLF